MLLLMPTAILLSISFFVLVAVNKVEEKSLKIFGWVICVVLWVTAALCVATGFTALTAGYSSECRMFNRCMLKGQKSGSFDPNHPWMNKPYHKGMLNDPHAGMMMDSMDGMMADPNSKIRCPGMQDDEELPEDETTSQPSDKK